MNAHELLANLRRRGVVLTVSAGKLEVDAPVGALNAADRVALARHKPELADLLTVRARRAASSDQRPELSIFVPPPDEAPDPFDRLLGPRRTAWGTIAWSDPKAPEIEAFGPAPGHSASTQTRGRHC